MKKIKPLIAAVSIALSPKGGAVQLLPAGVFDAPRGALKGKGPWTLTAAAAQRLIDKVAARINDILVDYEHQSLLTSQNGKPVPAAGWIDPGRLIFDGGKGLFAASVKWSDAAAAHIAADEYRYLSPVFTYDAGTGEVLDILNVALTNSPAIDGMDAVTLAAAGAAFLPTLPEESSMDELLEHLRYLLNLPLTSTADDIAVELDKLKAMIAGGNGESAAAGLISALTAKDDELAILTARNEEIAALAAATAGGGAEPDPALYAPIAVVRELRVKLAALSVGAVDNQVEKLIDAAVAAGKIIGESEKDWATRLGKKDIAELTAYLDSARPIAALIAMQTGGKAPGDTETAATSLTPEEQAVAEQLGLGRDEIIKQRSKQ